MTMFPNWSTKDEIETSNRTFQSVRGTKLKTHFLKLNEEVTKMGGKTYIIIIIIIIISMIIIIIIKTSLFSFHTYIFSLLL